MKATLRLVASAWHTPCYVDQAHRLIIVRRDHAAVFSAILRCPDRWPRKSAVMLDRRAGERRVQDESVSSDRRQRERRAPADPLWGRQGFMVVHVDQLPPEAILLDEVPAMPETLSLA